MTDADRIPDGAAVFVPGFGVGRVVHGDLNGAYVVDFRHLPHVIACLPGCVFDLGALAARPVHAFSLAGSRA